MDNNTPPSFFSPFYTPLTVAFLFLRLSFLVSIILSSFFNINTPLLFLSHRRLSRIHPPSSFSRLTRRSRFLSPLVHSPFLSTNQSPSVIYLSFSSRQHPSSVSLTPFYLFCGAEARLNQSSLFLVPFKYRAPSPTFFFFFQHSTAPRKNTRS
ncbi:hypothetical protein K457DRAFT_199386 [Linnemannia elongata AG-77]|uniref:Uncharacterized protein n=1 Tax=Linnemannia elongata AG-77 TaxID=1314771 RepID=A0A197JGY4_9FUNG|nr:hypothetical protein K457DRAFT_199386 [Linnemannia elongata AG-77]